MATDTRAVRVERSGLKVSFIPNNSSSVVLRLVLATGAYYPSEMGVTSTLASPFSVDIELDAQVSLQYMQSGVWIQAGTV